MRGSMFSAAVAATWVATFSMGQEILIDGGTINAPIELSGEEQLTILGPVAVDIDDPLLLTRALITSLDDSRVSVQGPVAPDVDGVGLFYVVTDRGTLEVSESAFSLLVAQGGGVADLESVTLTSEVGRNVVRIEDDARVTLRDSVVTSTNASPAIVVENRGRLQLDGSTLTSPASVALQLQDQANAQIQNTTLSSVFVSDNASVSFQDADLTPETDFAGGTVAFFASAAPTRFEGGRIVTAGSEAGLALQTANTGLVTLTGGAVVEGPRGILNNGRLRIEDATVSGGDATSTAGSAAISSAGISSLEIVGGTVQGGLGGAAVALSNGATAEVSGGIFLAAQGDEAGRARFDVQDLSQLTLIGDLTTFTLDGAMLPDGSATLDVVVQSQAGTLSGVFANGDLFDFDFTRDEQATIVLRDTNRPTGPLAVPSPSAAAAGLLMGVGLLRRRRR